MSDVRRYNINFKVPTCFGKSKVYERLSEAKISAVANNHKFKRLTYEQITYQNLEKLADAIITGQIIGNYIMVNGENREELYKEFFG